VIAVELLDLIPDDDDEYLAHARMLEGRYHPAVAAAQAGRDAILIDFDWRNVDLTRRRITASMHVHREVASHPVPRTDEEGRAGRTPVKGGHIRPIATRFTWHVDGARPAPAKPKPAPARQLSLAL